jgi:ATP-binding cassette subfamily C protein
LLGVAVFALLGTIAVRGIQSVDLSPRTKEIINFFNLQDLNNQNLISLLAVIASLLLISKTLISVIMNRKTQVFLSNTGARGSSEYIKKFLNNNLEILETMSLARLRFNATHGSRALFSGILGGFVTLITDGFLLTVMLLAIFLASPIVAFASTSIFVGAAAILHFIQRHKAFTLGSQSADIQLQVEQDLLAATQGFRDLYVFGKIQAMISRIEEKFFKIAKINAEMSIMPNVGKYVIEITLILGTLLAAAIQVTIADSARATSVMTVFLVAASRVAPALLRIQQGLLSIRANYGTAYEFIESYNDALALIQGNALAKIQDREGQIKSHLDIFTKIPDQKNRSKFHPIIKIENASYSFPNSSDAILKNINLKVEPGEKVAIVGASGSGKSTLVDLMLGLREPQIGLVTISGSPPREAIESWPGQIAYAPQKTFLLSGSVAENIEFFSPEPEYDFKRMKILISLLELGERLEDVNEINGFRTVSNDLSGGESQRLGLARALYRKPQLLVIDEATSALDARLEKSIVEKIMKRNKQNTVISITHRVSTIRLASRIIFITNGKISGDGTFRNLYKNHLEFKQQIDSMKFEIKN